MRCESLGSPQRGHGMKFGTAFFITCARRIAERDLDCLRFGTAIVRTFLLSRGGQSLILPSAASPPALAGVAAACLHGAVLRLVPQIGHRPRQPSSQSGLNGIVSTS